MPKAAFSTLGCKVNQYETEALLQLFEENGFTIVSERDPADVYILNSCTVTGEGDKKSRQLLRRFRRQNPGAVIVLTGCYPQAFPDEAKRLTDADIVTGTRNRMELLHQISRLLEKRKAGAEADRVIDIAQYGHTACFEPMTVRRLSDHTRAFVKIEDGCDRFCSYCIIPKARGPIRSKPMEIMEEELRGLVNNGYREVVLVGINLSSYGKETGRFQLAEAVQRACAVPGIERVRLGSLEPELLTPEDLDRLADLQQFCPQFHLSLQSGCADTLRRMNRHYTPQQYETLVRAVESRFSDRPGGVSITTDIMVGFPGETEQEFEESLDFCQRIGFARAHVFAYSVRPGTRAAEMPDQVPQTVKEERSHRMIHAMENCRNVFLNRQCGTIQPVLFETYRAGSYIGHTMNYTPVEVIHRDADIREQILPAAIESVRTADGVCVARIVSQ